jgi:hypothetical protein
MYTYATFMYMLGTSKAAPLTPSGLEPLTVTLSQVCMPRNGRFIGPSRAGRVHGEFRECKRKAENFAKAAAGSRTYL